MDADRLAENLNAVRANIDDALRRAGRPAGAARLVAVTKRRAVEAVRALVGLGVGDLGENYPQELWEKVDAMTGLDARWHLVGHLQGNKARRTLPMVSMVHGVDSLKLLKTLDALSADLADPPRACLQVNLSREPTKHGWVEGAILADAEAIAACRRVEVVGLMTMAAEGQDPRPSFVALRSLRDDLRGRTGLVLNELSMGMSGDYVEAVEEGATLVRVGSALFEGVG